LTEYVLRVTGAEPAPQGSKRHVGNGRMIEASKKVGPWRAAVAVAVSESLMPTIDTPVDVEVMFFLPRGRTVTRELPSTPPDIDKLCRSTLDGLVQGGALADDSLVVNLDAKKRYADGVRVGAEVKITVLGKQNTLI
jgi:crossover junction endodeoxyribonuclease RusA